MDRETVIQSIVTGDFTDNAFLKTLLVMTKEEPDDLIRSYARCSLQEKSLVILDRLLNS